MPRPPEFPQPLQKEDIAPRLNIGDLPMKTRFRRLGIILTETFAHPLRESRLSYNSNTDKFTVKRGPRARLRP